MDPKIAALRAAEAELKVATKEKNAAEDRMAIVQGKLDTMQASFDAAMAQKAALEEDAAMCVRKMDGATALLGALAGRFRLPGAVGAAVRLLPRPSPCFHNVRSKLVMTSPLHG